MKTLPLHWTRMFRRLPLSGKCLTLVVSARILRWYIQSIQREPIVIDLVHHTCIITIATDNLVFYHIYVCAVVGVGVYVNVL